MRGGTRDWTLPAVSAKEPSMIAMAVIGALAGLVVGSFIGVLGERWPRGEQVSRGRSRCEACEKTLGPHELVPLFSYLVQRGRCRGCHARIPRRLPLVELLAAGAGAISFAAARQPFDFAWAGFAWALIALALLDMRALWLPDRLTVPLALAGLAVAALQGYVLLSLAGALTGFTMLFLFSAIYTALRRRRGLGGGDPKLLAAIGAWLGPGALPLVLLFGSLLGLTAAAIMLVLGRSVSRNTKLPFGMFLIAGTACYVFLTHLPVSLAYGIPVP